MTLVLKRFSFIGDGLSHVAFGAMAVAAVLNFSDDMFIILPITIICAILLLRTGQNTRIKGEAAIAMISVGALAIGYLLMNIGNDWNRVNNGNTIDKVISEQMEKDDTAGQSIAPQSVTDRENSNIQNTGDVDYDLTKMNSDMVYAMVYQLMMDPDTYIGKTFRMDGLYYASYYEPTAKYYHYCLIQDALACCAQGLEFVWDDGSHIYPDEYPEDNTKVVVQGFLKPIVKMGILICTAA